MVRYTRRLLAVQSLWALGLWICAACGQAHETPSHEGAVTLRFRPTHGQRWREHWIYDLDAPGTGLERTALSFDVNVVRAEANSWSLRHSVRRQYHGREGKPEPLLELTGAQVNSAWSTDRALLGEYSVEGRSSEVAAAVRQLVLGARFGTLIEYPDQTISLGDSWSIEPRVLTVGPGLSAILRPSYVLEAITNKNGELEAKIGADIQVDLMPEVLDDSVVVEGGGTASGTLYVRVRDGVLLDARTILHFNQEVRVQGAETLGYREFSATAHVFETLPTAQPDLAKEPSKIEPADPEEERACSALLGAVARRIGRASASMRVYTLAALHVDALPALAKTSAALQAGTPVREPGSTLQLMADGKHVEFDGAVLELRELARAVRLPRESDILYVLAPASSTVDRLRTVLALLPRRASVRLLVRAGQAAPPKATRFVEEQLRIALEAVSPALRQTRLNQLLVEHLVLCEEAMDAYRKSEKSRVLANDLPRELLSSVARCGCTSTQVDGLELALSALYGTAEVRALRVPLMAAKRWASISGTASVQTLVSAYE